MSEIYKGQRDRAMPVEGREWKKKLCKQTNMETCLNTDHLFKRLFVICHRRLGRCEWSSTHVLCPFGSVAGPRDDFYCMRSDISRNLHSGPHSRAFISCQISTQKNMSLICVWRQNYVNVCVCVCQDTIRTKGKYKWISSNDFIMTKCQFCFNSNTHRMILRTHLESIQQTRTKTCWRVSEQYSWAPAEHQTTDNNNNNNHETKKHTNKIKTVKQKPGSRKQNEQQIKGTTEKITSTRPDQRR